MVNPLSDMDLDLDGHAPLRRVQPIRRIGFPLGCLGVTLKLDTKIIISSTSSYKG